MRALNIAAVLVLFALLARVDGIAQSQVGLTESGLLSWYANDRRLGDENYTIRRFPDHGRISVDVHTQAPGDTVRSRSVLVTDRAGVPDSLYHWHDLAEPPIVDVAVPDSLGNTPMLVRSEHGLFLLSETVRRAAVRDTSDTLGLGGGVTAVRVERDSLEAQGARLWTQRFVVDGMDGGRRHLWLNEDYRPIAAYLPAQAQAVCAYGFTPTLMEFVRQRDRQHVAIWAEATAIVERTAERPAEYVLGPATLQVGGHGDIDSCLIWVRDGSIVAYGPASTTAVPDSLAREFGGATIRPARMTMNPPLDADRLLELLETGNVEVILPYGFLSVTLAQAFEQAGVSMPIITVAAKSDTVPSGQAISVIEPGARCRLAIVNESDSIELLIGGRTSYRPRD